MDELERSKREWGIIDDPNEAKEVTRATAARRQALLTMWASGFSFDEIAEKFDLLNGKVARHIVESALARSDISIDRDGERQRFTRSLLEHHKTAFTNAQSDELDDDVKMAWMKMDVALIDRIAKLQGLDAPTQVVVTPGVLEFEKLAGKMALAAGEEVVLEADPMDGTYG